MSDTAVILKELSELKAMIESNTVATVWPRWLSMTDACKYAGGKSRNWMRKRLDNGDIYGYQETTPKSNSGNWTIDRNSIDFYFEKEDIF